MKKIALSLLLVFSCVVPAQADKYEVYHEEGYQKTLNYIFGLVYDYMGSGEKIDFVLTQAVKNKIEGFGFSYRFQLIKDLEFFEGKIRVETMGKCKDDIFRQCESYKNIRLLEQPYESFSSEYSQVEKNLKKRLERRRKRIILELLAVIDPGYFGYKKN